MGNHRQRNVLPGANMGYSLDWTLCRNLSSVGRERAYWGRKSCWCRLVPAEVGEWLNVVCVVRLDGREGAWNGRRGRWGRLDT